MHDFYFLIHLPNRKVFKSMTYPNMEICIMQCEKKLRELHINYSDGVELGYTDEHGDKWLRRPEHGEVMP